MMILSELVLAGLCTSVSTFVSRLHYGIDSRQVLSLMTYGNYILGRSFFPLCRQVL